MTVHSLTIDLEDWHQLLFRRLGGEFCAPSVAAIDATHRLLDMLDETNTKATFFAMGRLARAFPDLVREVARRGHEIGSHSHNHQLIYRMSPDAFREEMAVARARLQDLVGEAVLGFRAPEFSVQRLDHWCFDVLAEVGFEYDSSVFPSPARYGIPTAPRTPFTIQTKSGPIAEFPVASWCMRGHRLAIAGGTYWRLWPRAVLDRALRDLEAEHVPAVLYFHPYEFHRGFLRLSNLGWASTLNPAYLKYVALHNMMTGRIGSRLSAVLRRHPFQPLGQLHSWRARTAAARPQQEMPT
jgi:polysaccharide deacetylase family protein (PEP-CTERM system associated)